MLMQYHTCLCSKMHLNGFQKGSKFHQIWMFGRNSVHNPHNLMLVKDEDIDKTWQQIADVVGKDLEEVRESIAPANNMYIILDHTKTVMITIIEGSLSSNVSGRGRVCNILRRVFSVLQKNDWLEKIEEMKHLLELFE
ncbi:unnamed protein product [Moneuplotes crassus]|uniref:Uncharacterized protein n=1 Tax=Euplotes crassus TaxID=5936 RepID=A0AAD1XXJ7_EUPCR|nr:unnamed protein product [Moneuplotes crassus]